MAKNLERIGDHATNIAETLYFLVHGTPLAQVRPKRDRTSLGARARRRRRRARRRRSLMRPSVWSSRTRRRCSTLLRYNLEKEGFAVAEAHDGEEALLQLKEAKPDAVLLDWMLPRVSGIEVCRQIRRAPAWTRSCRSSC